MVTNADNPSSFSDIGERRSDRAPPRPVRPPVVRHSFKPARARHNSRLELLKQHLRVLLRRELTMREEQLLELSEPMFDTIEIQAVNDDGIDSDNDDDIIERSGTG
jgi:hypothetical protein